MLDVSSFASDLTLGPDGIWHCAKHESVSYPSTGHDDCLKIEESSFWFSHRNDCITAAVKNYPPAGPIFDIGGGNGFVSCGLIKAGFETVLVEPGPAGASNGKRRGVPTVICATTAAGGFKPSALNAVGLFDVIEHIQDDCGFLLSIRALLKPGGCLYATVPAYPALWSNEDVSAGHFRRYTTASLKRLVEKAGFCLEYSTYFFRPLPIPLFLLRTLPYRLGLTRNPANDHRPGSPGLINRLLRNEILRIRVGRRMNFGGSCLVVARPA
ncbi:MAG: class I SAM-dependent methyltransferase [Chitinispirillaceae bacterium]|nr:class I SAM-dependent methyltransferase [Chitinispirillaceae bacterium]